MKFCLILVSGFLIVGSSCLAADQPTIDFARDIKPILVARCYRCHSSVEQESGLRLDRSEAITKGGEGGKIIAPGKSGESRLIAAVLRSGDLKMPPEGDPLTAEQIDKLEAWIDAGATLPADGKEGESNHWSFKPPTRPALPKVENEQWAANPIDALVAAKHAEHKLLPNDPAPKNLLLRRVYLDLIGLPPTAEELAAFANDTSPDAYERVVDKLLASPHYGERWGRHWMDVWRYSDWDGFGAEVRESKPHIWRWRDWIVESLNDDKPYDRMVQEMLAADELAPDDPQSLRATGYLVRSWYKFNRNKWLDDTVEHTGKAFLGLTFNCCRCHDHMYDPLAQLEYYSLRAIFEPYDIRTDRVPGQANTEQDGLVRVYDAKPDEPTYLFVRGNEKDPRKEESLKPGVPALVRNVSYAAQPVSLPAAGYYPGLLDFVREEAQASARSGIEKSRTEIVFAEKAVVAARDAVANQVAKTTTPEPNMRPPEAKHWLVDDFAKADGALWKVGPGKWEYRDGKLVQSDPRDEPCGLLTQKPAPRDFVATFRYKLTGGDTYRSVGIAFDARDYTNLQSVYLSAHSPGPHRWERVGGTDNYPESAPKATAVAIGQTIELQVAVRDKLVNVWVNGKRVLAYALKDRAADGHLMLWTYDATAEFLNATIDELPGDFSLVEKVDAKPVDTMEQLAAAERSLIAAKQRMDLANAALEVVQAKIAADAANYATPPAANAAELSMLAGTSERRHALLTAELDERQAEEKLATAQRNKRQGDMNSEKAVKDTETALNTAREATKKAREAAEKPDGNYTRLTPVYQQTSTGRRLALAKWITARDNPLAARVAVNHLWLRHFGSPLVPSVFDFGHNGKTATNQPLLDWLAVELMKNGWRMKPIHKRIVMSRTYQLASTAGTNERQLANAKIDPENLYYWRANVRRMEAEIVRDATLFVAGSLDTKRGGPDLDQTTALANPRRSIYFRATKEKKAEFLAIFDSANPVECYKRSESIAPQQALAMANSTLTLAQSRLLAKKISDEVGEDRERFINATYLRILCREATKGEQTACTEFLDQQQARFADPKSLNHFATGPAASVAPSTDPKQRARESLVHVLFNHNDFVTIR